MSTQTLVKAITHAKGMLDRTALKIGVMTDADSEREFRSCIAIAMQSICHAAKSQAVYIEALETKLDNAHEALSAALTCADFASNAEDIIRRGLNNHPQDSNTRLS